MTLPTSTALPLNLNLASFFLDCNLAEGRGERAALITPDGPCSYEELASLTNRAGNVLRDLGVREQDRVLIALSDSVEFVATWYAAQKIGAVTAEVYTFLPPKDYTYYLDYSGAVVVVVDRSTLGPMRQAVARGRTRPVVLVVGVHRDTLQPGEECFDSLVRTASPELSPAVTNRDQPAVWKFTTGSTGRPKACVHSRRSPVASYQSYARDVLDMRFDDVVLPVPKLFFGYARDLAALFPFGVGGAGIIFPERTTPGRIFELIARHRPSILVNVPTMMQAMLAHPSADHKDLSCLRLCTSAGEALPEAIRRRWIERFGVPVLDGIGSSEAYHIYISNRAGRERPGSIGETVPGYSAEVVDADGRPLPDGEAGRLWLRGDTAALMYWGDAARSAETFAGDLVMTGDLVERDPDGYFWYRGRADDLLKVGGIWVAPDEIERCLSDHPAVAECAVVGSERDGLTRICAFVVSQSGAELSSEALQAFLRERLSGHKVPREIHVVGRLPHTGSGKIDRQTLRETATAIDMGEKQA